MPLRLFTTFLFALVLLLGTLGCAKKDGPVTDQINTGTYTLNGVVTPCQVKVSTLSGRADNLIADYLDLQFTPTDPQRSGETVLIHFIKSIDAPTSTYDLSLITFSSSAGPLPFAVNYSVPEANATLSQLSNGGYSGTFSATFNRFSNQIITAGIFTDVRL
jgi:hypothetical protein